MKTANSKLSVVALCILVASISGCKNYRYTVNCDSGFTTGSAYRAHAEDGVIKWLDDSRQWSSRKMIQGEICQVIKFEQSNNKG